MDKDIHKLNTTYKAKIDENARKNLGQIIYNAKNPIKEATRPKGARCLIENGNLANFML